MPSSSSLRVCRMNGGGGPKYALIDETKFLHPLSEDNKFSSPVICHQLTADDQSIMKSSPNSQPTVLSQLTTANLHMEMEDGSVKEEEGTTNYVMPSYTH
jgi:hypothetical protein